MILSCIRIFNLINRYIRLSRKYLSHSFHFITNKHKHAAHKAKLHACASKGKVDILNRSWQEHIHTIDDLNREVNRWQNWNGIPW